MTKSKNPSSKMLSPEYNALSNIQLCLFKLSNLGDNTKIYKLMNENLNNLNSQGYVIQTKNLILFILKAYKNNSDLVSELKKLLNEEERKNYDEWLQKSGNDNISLRCTNCNSSKMVLNINKLAIYETAESDISLKNYIEYDCAECECSIFQHID